MQWDLESCANREFNFVLVYRKINDTIQFSWTHLSPQPRSFLYTDKDHRGKIKTSL